MGFLHGMNVIIWLVTWLPFLRDETYYLLLGVEPAQFLPLGSTWSQVHSPHT